MASPVSASRQSLHDELLGRVRSLIIKGDLLPGTKVPERELCGRFNVSRTPLREVLKVLASEGLVRLPPNRGAVISEIRLDVLDDTFQVLAELEGLAARCCCANMSDAQIVSLRGLHERIREQYAQENLRTYRTLNRQYHACIISGAQNRVLADEHLKLSLRVQRAHLVATFSRERWSAAMAEHDAIMDCLEARGEAEIAHLMRTHILNARDHYRTILPAARPRRR
jgi:DNA-binding GntR family transcriptional regulator